MVELLPRWNIKVCSEVRIIFSNKKINHREISRILRDCKINITLSRLKDDDILEKILSKIRKEFLYRWLARPKKRLRKYI